MARKKQTIYERLSGGVNRVYIKIETPLPQIIGYYFDIVGCY